MTSVKLEPMRWEMILWKCLIWI